MEEVQLFVSSSLYVHHSYSENKEEIFMLFGMRQQVFSYFWSFGKVSHKLPLPSGHNLAYYSPVMMVFGGGNPRGTMDCK